jgi:hypothetical protein
MVRDLVSFVVAPLSLAAELIKDCVNVVATNRVCWGTRSVLTTTLSHFLELATELELLGSRHTADLMEYQADGLWTQVRQAMESLASFIPLSVTCVSPDDTGQE